MTGGNLMVDKGRRLIALGGAVLMVSGAALLFTAGAAPAQAASTAAHHGARAHTSSPNCGSQPNRNNPTNTQNKVLDSYHFTVMHGSTTTTVCSLFPNVRAGDIVTAYFTLHSGASQGTQLSLVAYGATDENTAQTLFDCASFGVSSGACASTSASALTVHVPPCGFQVDFIYGAPLQSHSEGDYAKNHVWITGQLGDISSEVVCTNATPTATPTPTSSVQAITTVTTPTTPSTGAGSTGQAALGLMLIALGGSGVVFGGRRLRGAEV